MTLPETFKERMKTLLDTEYEAYLDSMEAPPQYGLRVNTAKISVDDFIRCAPFPIEKIPWIPNGFFYQQEDQPAKHPYYYAGLYYIQEPSAMTPASRLPIKPGDRVLDLCAAPGGKATELGARLQGEGLLVANDISSSRAKGLLKNIELFGVANVAVISEDPKKLLKGYRSYFDKILLDAPCSGEGMFRRDPKLINAWQERGPQYYSEIQKELIVQAVEMLRPGGQLLYSTCTFSIEENEAVIATALAQYPELELVEIEGYEGFSAGRMELDRCVRIFPHKMSGEGHFTALLHKRADGDQPAEKNTKRGKAGAAAPAEAQSFLAELAVDFSNGSFHQIQERLYFLPEQLKLEKGLRYLRTGLYLGDVKKNRFEPSQALAMALTKEQFPASISFAADDIRTLKYLKGETVDIQDCDANGPKGWRLICVDNYPLGWGKAQGGMLKNKYYSGWRQQ